MRTTALSSLLAATLLVVAKGFSVPHRLVAPAFLKTARYATQNPKYVNPEYSTVEEEEVLVESIGDDDVDDAVEAPPQAVTKQSETTTTPSATAVSSNQTPNLQYAAMEPGTVVHIQVGDVSLARKAWKKRRRSGSPLLVPCSVLNVDRQSTIRWNLIYLLEKFGSSSNGGIRMSLAELTRRHRQHLQSSLTQHAEEMGYEAAQDLVEALFNKQVQETYGVKLVVEDNNENDNDNTNTLWLQAPLSRHRGQKRASSAAVLQFSDEHDDTLLHTGIVRNRRDDDSNNNHASSKNNTNIYQLKPLSCALRVSQSDVDSGTIQDGSMHAAVVFVYDKAGDGGAPMLTLSLNPACNQVRDRLKLADQRHHQVIVNPKHMLHELAIGKEVNGKVVRLIKGGALVDCSVGRIKSDQTDTFKVYGFLRFQDAVVTEKQKKNKVSFESFVDDDDDYEEEEEEEEMEEEDWEDIMSSVNEEMDDGEQETHLSAVLKKLDNDKEFEYGEDITHLFDVKEDGSLTYHDPESGETQVISQADDNDDEEEDISHLFEMQEDGSLTFQDPESGETKVISLDHDHDHDDDEEEEEEEELPVVSKSFSKKLGGRPRRPERRLDFTPSPKPQRVHVGDQVTVFVKSVSKQSSQFLLTMDASIQGRKAKDLKKDAALSKKMSRLAKQLGGLSRMKELRGQEYDGVVKATSNTGDWLYVQPAPEELPVGIASVGEESLSDLHQGDAVRIRIEGIDEERGQLAMRVLHKL
jgi:hypothetical protein